MFEARNPNAAEQVRRVFSDAPFIEHLGAKLEDCGPGWCESSLILRPEHLQQDGFVHAGIEATLGDHTAGAAAATLIAEDEFILTSSFTVHLLRPGKGERLSARADVIKPGRRLSVVESSVFAEQGDESVLVAKLSVTLAVVPK